MQLEAVTDVLQREQGPDDILTLAIADMHAGRLEKRGDPLQHKLSFLEHLTQLRIRKTVMVGDMAHRTLETRHKKRIRKKESAMVSERLEQIHGQRIRLPGNHDKHLNGEFDAHVYPGPVYQDGIATYHHGHDMYDEAIAALLAQTENDPDRADTTEKRLPKFIKATGQHCKNARDGMVLWATKTDPQDVYAALATKRTTIHNGIDTLLEHVEEKSVLASRSLEGIWMTTLWMAHAARNIVHGKLGKRARKKQLRELINRCSYYTDISNATAMGTLATTQPHGCIGVSGHTHEPGITPLWMWHAHTKHYEPVLSVNTGSWVQGNQPTTAALILEREADAVAIITRPGPEGIPVVMQKATIPIPGKESVITSSRQLPS